MIEMTIPSMRCGGCARGIARVCAEVDPAAKVKADPRTKRVSIDTMQDRAKFVQALSAAGYRPA
ncbi:heavy-metal-associated domain-containing protein [Ramlibacter sp.]|uniref:heavy-metal-associated domain-containing protein n=1 Tax=Ramlibacter sp. TaxID=1917967 RepID=UPI003D10D604